MADPVAVPIKEEPQAVKKEVAIEDQPKDTINLGIDYKTFMGTKGVPFVADELGIGDYYKQDIEGDIKPKVDFISKYLLEKGDLVELGKDIIEGIRSKLNISDDVKPLAKLDRIYQYILATQRLKALEEKKKAINYLIEKEEEKKKTPFK